MNRKLSAGDIVEARRLHQVERWPLRRIAERFGVNASTVSRAVRLEMDGGRALFPARVSPGEVHPAQIAASLASGEARRREMERAFSTVDDVEIAAKADGNLPGVLAAAKEKREMIVASDRIRSRRHSCHPDGQSTCGAG